MTESAPMDFTGERFTPECVREIWYEHWHRYVFARAFARGKRVLDAACGEGYGSALLAAAATSVLGVDISQDAVAHARACYADRATNLRFERGDCTALDVAPASFDLITSFETLEHVAAQQALIEGFAHALSADGLLIISSPDKRTYSDVSGFRNEFHVRELYRDELLALLKPHFPFIHLYGQKLLFQSTIWSLDGAGQKLDAATSRGEEPQPGLDYEPLYFIAICSKQPLVSDLPGVALFGDREESVYQHYNGEVRKNMAAGARLAQLEAEVATLRRELENTENVQNTPPPPRTSWWRRLFSARKPV